MQDTIQTLTECADVALRHFDALTGQDPVSIEDVTEAPGSCFAEIERYPCVSTAYVEKDDLTLLLDSNAPGHLANHDQGYGAYFYIPAVGKPDDPAAFEEHIQTCLEFGFSLRFTEILRLARAEDVAYITFDRDGGEMNGLERTES